MEPSHYKGWTASGIILDESSGGIRLLMSLLIANNVAKELI
jgi:hypothetical protein